jgi:hypothetical protein
MIRDSAVDLLMGRLGKRQNAFTQQDIINEMVYVQDTLLEGDATPFWFLLTEAAETTTIPDEERITLPTDFLQEWEEGALYIVVDGEDCAMVKDDWDTIKNRVTGSGQPEYYALAGDYFLVRKIPDAVYTVKMRYYGRQASLAGTYGSAVDTDGNIENNWLKWASDLLIAETGIVIANQYLQSEKMLQLFAAQATVARKRLIAKDTIMRETNIQRFMEG